MKQQQPPTSKNGFIQDTKSLFPQSPSKPPLADSWEVILDYYSDRINELSRQMELLNLLEDASQIEFLCRKIINARIDLRNIGGKKTNIL